MKYFRVISRLDIKGPNLVKGIHLEGLRVLGKPEEFAVNYYEQGADELIYQDTVASLYQRNSLLDIITRTAEVIFIPLTVGGGLRKLEDINKVLRAGADKVSINTAAIKNPGFINDAAKTFGSSTIVISIETIRQPDGSYLAYTDNGREYTGVEVLDWAREVEDRGAGEILLTSIDHEGTGNGFDEELVQSVSSLVSIPVIAHGGAGCSNHVVDAIQNGKADAIAIASMFHYSLINSNVVKGHHEEEGNIEFLKQKRSFKTFGQENIASVKNTLNAKGIPIRHYV